MTTNACNHDRPALVLSSADRLWLILTTSVRISESRMPQLIISTKVASDFSHSKCAAQAESTIQCGVARVAPWVVVCVVEGVRALRASRSL